MRAYSHASSAWGRHTSNQRLLPGWRPSPEPTGCELKRATGSPRGEAWSEATARLSVPGGAGTLAKTKCGSKEPQGARGMRHPPYGRPAPTSSAQRDPMVRLEGYTHL